MLRCLGVALLGLLVVGCQPEGKSSRGPDAGDAASAEGQSVGGSESPQEVAKGPGSIRAWECQKFWDEDDRKGPVIQPNPDWTPDKRACGPVLPEGLMVLEREDGTVKVEELLGGYIRKSYDCKLVESLTNGVFVTYQCFDPKGVAVGTLELDQTRFLEFAARGDSEGIKEPISDGYFWPGTEIPKAGVESSGLRLRCGVDVTTKHYDEALIENPQYCDPAAEEAARKFQEQVPVEPEQPEEPVSVFI